MRVVASLPCYGEDNVDEQRGSGVFQRSIQVAIILCSLEKAAGMQDLAVLQCGLAPLGQHYQFASFNGAMQGYPLNQAKSLDLGYLL